MIERSDVMQSIPSAIHDYGWVASHMALLVAAGWTLLLIGVLVALTAQFGVPPASWALAALCGIWLGLVALALWGQRNSKRRLRRVAVYEDGLSFGDASGTKATFVPWNQIDRVETFSHPHRDALYMNRSGLRLRVGDRQFFIYQHIAAYDRLLQQVQSRTAHQ